MTLTRGAKKKVRTIHGIRSLAREDLAALQVRRNTPVVQRFRDPHHLLARILAAGIRTEQAAEMAGYSQARVLVLHADPAFQELIAHYRTLVTQAYIEGLDTFFSLATKNMVMAERQLAEKLEEADEEGKSLSVRELTAISRDAADRFGYGKKSTNVNVNVDFAAQLERAIARSGKTIEAKPVEGARASLSARPMPLASRPPQALAPPGDPTRGPVAPTLLRRRA